MKITFLIPPPKSGEKAAERSAGCTHIVYPVPNIYELYVIASLEQEGYTVAYKDFVAIHKTQADFVAFLQSDTSDCYCMWSVNLSIQTDLFAHAEIRRIRKNVPIIYMGPAPTYFSKIFLVDEHTFVIRGEAEITIKALCKQIVNASDLSLVDGISFLKEHTTIHNNPRELCMDLDVLPFPARKFVEHIPYYNPKLQQTPYTTILTSRNCPFSCIYCIPSSLSFAREIEHKNYTKKKPAISYRSIENIAQELQLLYTQGYKAIGIMDDNFIMQPQRFTAIANELAKYDFSWGCQARVDAITQEVAQVLAQTKCAYVDLGVESFNDEVLTYIKKGITSKQIFECIALLNKYKVPIKLNILIGTYPYETRKQLLQTLRIARNLDVEHIMFNIVLPFPGTEFYDIVMQNGWLVGKDFTPTDVQRNSIVSYPQLTAKQMERLLFRSNLQFFSKPTFIWKNVRKISSIPDFAKRLLAVYKKLFG